MFSRCIAALTCLVLLLGPGLAREKDRSPDDQVKDLIAKYQALPEKDQKGAEGEKIIKQLKALPGKLSAPSKEAIARLETAHNLRQIAIAIHNVNDPTTFPFPAFPIRTQWEYKGVSEADLLKLGKDDFAAGLNKLGEEGWELVLHENHRYVFKRQKLAPLPIPPKP